MNHAKLTQVNAAIERGEMREGHYFCAGCQRITLVDTEGPCLRCVICGSPRVKYHLVVCAPRRVDPVTAHAWFEAARQAAG